MVFDCPFPAGWAALGYALLLAGAYLLGVWQGAGAAARGRAPREEVGEPAVRPARSGGPVAHLEHACTLADNRRS